MCFSNCVTTTVAFHIVYTPFEKCVQPQSTWNIAYVDGRLSVRISLSGWFNGICRNIPFVSSWTNVRNFTRRPTCIYDGCLRNRDRFCTVRCEMTPKKHLAVQRSRLLRDKHREDNISLDESTRKITPQVLLDRRTIVRIWRSEKGLKV